MTCFRLYVFLSHFQGCAGDIWVEKVDRWIGIRLGVDQRSASLDERGNEYEETELDNGIVLPLGLMALY